VKLRLCGPAGQPAGQLSQEIAEILPCLGDLGAHMG
jgi:hypothetical protein